jgi:hypothetical protein
LNYNKIIKQLKAKEKSLTKTIQKHYPKVTKVTTNLDVSTNQVYIGTYVWRDKNISSGRSFIDIDEINWKNITDYLLECEKEFDAKSSTETTESQHVEH